MPTRRQILATSLAAATGVSRRARAEDGSIRIGAAYALSGSQANLGNIFRAGAQIAVNQVNAAGGVNGRPVELVVRDDKASANDTVTAVREMLGSGVRFIVGGQFTASTTAALPAVAEAGGVFLATGATTVSLNHELAQRSLFHVYPNAHMLYKGQGRIFAERYPQVRKWGAMVANADYARANWGAMQAGLRQYYKEINHADVEFIEPAVAKFGASDYKQQIAQLVNSPVEGLYNALAGSDNVTFLTQARAFGLESKLKVYSDVGTDLVIAKAMKKNLPPSTWSTIAWYYGAPGANTISQALHRDFTALMNDPYPPGVTWGGHSAVLSLVTAFRAAPSLSPDAVIAALEAATVETASGPMRFRKEDHQAMPVIGFVRMSPSDADPGWKVDEYAQVAGADVIEPASSTPYTED